MSQQHGRIEEENGWGSGSTVLEGRGVWGAVPHSHRRSHNEWDKPETNRSVASLETRPLSVHSSAVIYIQLAACCYESGAALTSTADSSHLSS